jgi:translation initiation factor IF-3
VLIIANSKGDLLINEQIRIPQVLVIGPNGEQTGVKSIKDAQTLANYAGLDLVLIGPNGNPPVCKLMDYSKFKYENIEVTITEVSKRRVRRVMVQVN